MQRRGESGQPAKGERQRTRPNARKAPTAQGSTDHSPEQFDRLEHERDEALEQQAATSEVLRVISRSPMDAQPVFDMIAESAARLCQGQFCFVYRFDGQLLHFVAHHSLTPEVLEMNRRAYPAPPSRRSAAARAILERSFVQIPDINADPDYVLGAMAVVGNYRSVVAVPILRNGLPIGAIAVSRAQAGLLPDRQIELLKTFADQAAIAIENVRLFEAEHQRTRELSESLDQQTATSEVLKVISSSPGKLEPVFNSMLENATRICEANFGIMFLYESDYWRPVAQLRVPPKFSDWLLAESRRWGPGTGLGRLAKSKQLVHIVDVKVDGVYAQGDPGRVAFVELAGARTFVAVPMLKDDALIGALAIFRQEVQPFTDKQIELVKNFAAQAVIAIENTRLLSELRQRTDDLTESLEQQTATSEVLKVISSSPGELQPVFEAMLENGVQVCGAKFGVLFRYENRLFHPTAMLDVPPAFAEFLIRQGAFAPQPGQLFGRLCESKNVIHVEDRATEPQNSPSARLAGARSALAVPMLKADELVGAFFIYRTEVRPFTDKQIELIKNFAAQAVIAIENTRLLTELRQRTADLSESLEQQTATSEVLSVISSSAGELQPVFDTMLAKAVDLCEASFGAMWLVDGEGYRTAALHGDLPKAYAEQWRSGTLHRPKAAIPMVRAIQSREPVHVTDMRQEKAYLEGDPLAVSAADIGGIRTLVVVPMLKDGEAVGVITIYRKEVRAFSDKQVELVSNFAKQAVIAIENARLLNELRQRTDDLSESLEQQTATSEVLKVISSSPGEIEPVFEAMLEKAVRICDANFGMLFRVENGAVSAAAMFGVPPAFAEFWRREPQRPGPRTALGRIIETRQTVHIADVKVEPAYVEGEPVYVAAVSLGGFRTVIGVPMLKDNKLIGAIAIYRQEVQLFTNKQIELVTNFAAQAVIAIENTRLLNEVRESLQQQTATADVLKVISRSATDVQPVFETIARSAVDLCGATYGIVFRYDGELITMAAHHNLDDAALEAVHRIWPMRPDNRTVMGRTILKRDVVHVPDVESEPSLTFAAAHRAALGIRTYLGVPMLRDGNPIGAIALYRREVALFSERQIELVKAFADQAVIAIENTRLLDELRESLQQQTATADVLKVISSSTGELQPVFQAMLENAVRICGAKFGNLWLREGDAYRIGATHGAPAAYVDFLRTEQVFLPKPDSQLGQLAKTKEVYHLADLTAVATYGDRLREATINLAGARTLVVVPMLKDDEVVGAVAIYRQEVRPFTDKQVELVKNFAAQAVIAIENARLLNELRTRTNELAQSVGELQALGEVSQAVNSTLELETVLTTIVGRAVELSHTDTGAIYVFDGERKEFRLHATYGMSEAMIAAISGQHIGLGHGNVGMATTQRRPVQVADIRDEPASPVNEIILREGYRSILVIPLLRADDIVGALVVRRKAPGEFPQSTIDLLQTFADQSVVAIQNARLYENVETRTRELAKSLEDLRTTQDRLVQTQKLASLGQLTAGIAHEIKNPLNFVNNFSGVSTELIDELQDALSGLTIDQKARAEINELTDTLRGNLDKVFQHGKRADAIVKNMLLHSREGSGEHRVVDINALVEESLNLAWHGARAERQGFDITLERSFDPTAGEADLYPQDITRALLNLISNGFYSAIQRKAETNGGDYVPTLAASTKSLGDRVEIRIRDNGTGIPPEVKEKMFNPFFTTKPAGEGTGLGLSISHDIIVKQHGGSIEVDTQPGEFTEIRIILPRAAVFVGESAGRA